MKVLKGIVLGLIGFILFLSLLILGVAFTVYNTVLNPQFVVNEVGKLDIPAVGHQLLADQIPAQDKIYLNAIDRTLTDTQPWIKQQLNYVVYGSYDYLLGKSDKLNLSIATQPLQQSLVKNLTAEFLKSPPAEYNQLPASEKDRYLTQFQQQITTAIPAKIEINQSTVGSDIMSQLQQAKEIVNHFRMGYLGLLALTLILILLAALIIRELKGISRFLGIVFLISGIISTAAFFATKYSVANFLPIGDLPGKLQTWVPQVINDLLFTWGIFSLAIPVMGLILLVISFFFRSRQPVSAIESSTPGS